jgi:hypothetical protein
MIHSKLSIETKNKEVTNTILLGLGIYKHLDWKMHTEQRILKLSTVCNAVKFVYHFSHVDTLKNNLICIFLFSNKVWKYTVWVTLQIIKGLSITEYNRENYERHKFQKYA